MEMNNGRPIPLRDSLPKTKNPERIAEKIAEYEGTPQKKRWKAE